MKRHNYRPVPTDIRGGLFDMDGTLVDSERWMIESWRIICERRGIDLATVDRSRYVGLPGDEAMALFIGDLGLTDDPGALYAEWGKETKRLVFANARLCPGVGDVLAWFERFGIPKVVVTTSGTAYSERLLELVGIRGRFMGLVTKDVMRGLGGRTKPAPDPYLHAARRLMRVLPEHCLAFEDSVVGVISARTAGAYVTAVSHGDARMEHALLQAGADQVLPTLEHFRAAPA